MPPLLFIDNWIARFRRRSATKVRKSVLTFDRYEEMTATQALRFEDLQAAVQEAGHPGDDTLPDQPWYSLDDAGRRIGASKALLLNAAAKARVQCFVFAGNTEGYWDAAASTPVPASVPDLLLLPSIQCREIAKYRSVKVKVLEYHHSPKNVLRYRLKEAAWVDADLLYLQHPLPGPEAFEP